MAPVTAAGDAPQSPLPSLVADWVVDCVGGPVPIETSATCSDCAMCRPPNRMVTGHAKAFQPDTKCCTFMPHLPNFVVGQILKDRSPSGAEGRVSVERRIDAKIGVTPLGLDPTEVYQLLYASSKDSSFGQSRALRCPHFIDRSGGLCGIWKYRNSICSTYHCKYVRGAIGRAFWERLRQLLLEVETALERWCVLQLAIGDAALGALIRPGPAAKKAGSQLTAAAVDERSDPHEYRRLWGDTWANREPAFYIAAATLVEKTQWSDVLAIGGARLKLLARLTCAAYEELTTTALAPRLEFGNINIALEEGGFVTLQGYSAQDQLIVPGALLDVLPLFDGNRTTEDAIRAARAAGVSLTHWFVRRLADFGVLQVPDPISSRATPAVPG